ncbi:hypothetical protein [Methanothrix soehngenii]|mgnify:FL=1|uniref:hypothetical protein n=1 Tax=Methanothrix soehngenii TaxID=2223 RepID=UPI002FDF9D0F
MASSLLSPSTPANVNVVLDGIESLAARMVDLKNETLEKETAILEAIIKRVTPLLPLLSKNQVHSCRCRIIIAHDRIDAPLDGRAYFYSESDLILYENGQLVRTHRYGDFRASPGEGWEIFDEYPLDASTAIEAIGLDAIVTGIINALEEAEETIILPIEVEARLIALSKILEGLQ